jgi:antitoxin MazE
MKIQVGKWGNSLAIRLPKSLTEEFGIAEGDEIDDSGIIEALRRAQAEEKQRRREKAIEEIRKSRLSLPDDWKFDREEANWRPAMDRW